MADRGPKPKLITYRKLKTRLRLEKYLLTPGFYSGRSYMTALRSGTNKLEIETGRYFKVKPELRLCRCCELKCIEDEEHFTVKCPAWNEGRDQLFFRINLISNGKWDVMQMNLNDRF